MGKVVLLQRGKQPEALSSWIGSLGATWPGADEKEKEAERGTTFSNPMVKRQSSVILEQREDASRSVESAAPRGFWLPSCGYASDEHPKQGFDVVVAHKRGEETPEDDRPATCCDEKGYEEKLMSADNALRCKGFVDRSPCLLLTAFVQRGCREPKV